MQPQQCFGHSGVVSLALDYCQAVVGWVSGQGQVSKQTGAECVSKADALLPLEIRQLTLLLMAV